LAAERYACAALSIQERQRFYLQATRSTRLERLPHQLAVGLIRSWTRFAVQEMPLPPLEAALEIKRVHGFSYWDSAIRLQRRERSDVAAAIPHTCRMARSSGGRRHQSVPLKRTPIAGRFRKV